AREGQFINRRFAELDLPHQPGDITGLAGYPHSCVAHASRVLATASSRSRTFSCTRVHRVSARYLEVRFGATPLRLRSEQRSPARGTCCATQSSSPLRASVAGLDLGADAVLWRASRWALALV